MAKKMNKFEAALSGALAAVKSAQAEYRTDAQGRKVRVWSDLVPCTNEDIRDALVGKQAIEEGEALEAFGANVLAMQVRVGRLYDMGHGTYAVTLDAQKYFDLPKKRVEGLAQVPVKFFGTLTKKWVRA